MTEDHDSKISELYRTVSQETPPARLDQAVLDHARKSMRRGSLSPFGNHWVAGGALAAVAIMSVLLVQLLPQQPDDAPYSMDAEVPLSKQLNNSQLSVEQLEELDKASPAGAEAERESPAAPAARFDFYSILPEKDQAAEANEPIARDQEIPSVDAGTAAVRPSASSAPVYYLQAGSFQESARALALNDRLVELGFKCEIQEVRISDTEIYHRVRVGPFSDSGKLRKSREALAGKGYETQVVTAE